MRRVAMDTLARGLLVCLVLLLAIAASSIASKEAQLGPPSASAGPPSAGAQAAGRDGGTVDIGTGSIYCPGPDPVCVRGR